MFRFFQQFFSCGNETRSKTQEMNVESPFTYSKGFFTDRSHLGEHLNTDGDTDSWNHAISAEIYTSRGGLTARQHDIEFVATIDDIRKFGKLSDEVLKRFNLNSQVPIFDKDLVYVWKNVFRETVNELISGSKLTQLGKDTNYYVSSFVTLSSDGMMLSTADGGYSIIEFPVDSIKRVYEVKRAANITSSDYHPVSAPYHRVMDYIVAAEFSTKKCTLAFVFRDPFVACVFHHTLEILVKRACNVSQYDNAFGTTLDNSAIWACCQADSGNSTNQATVIRIPTEEYSAANGMRPSSHVGVDEYDGEVVTSDSSKKDSAMGSPSVSCQGSNHNGSHFVKKSKIQIPYNKTGNMNTYDGLSVSNFKWNSSELPPVGPLAFSSSSANHVNSIQDFSSRSQHLYPLESNQSRSSANPSEHITKENSGTKYLKSRNSASEKVHEKSALGNLSVGTRADSQRKR